jgi:uncharacterized protein (TIGR02001 family)
MKSIKTLALVTGLLAISGVSQAQFSSTWTAVSDYDFRGVSQSAKNPALQGSADYAFSNGLSVGAWASNVDFDVEDDIELDLYANYVGKINDTFSWTAGATWYDYPTGDDLDGYWEAYVGFNAGKVSFKQWFADDFYALGESAEYTELNYTEPMSDSVSLALHAGYSWGAYWDSLGDSVGKDGQTFDYAVQVNWTVGHFTLFGKITGTDASGPLKVEGDVANNEARGLIGVTTTFPWSN